jgi:hypothetical protein
MGVNSWFRMYSEFADDPKVQKMSEAMQRRLVMLFCERSCDVLVTLSDADLAFHWRISDEELAKTKALFMDKGFIDEYWNVLNWNKRQFISDSSTGRTRKYRERHRTSQVNPGTSQAEEGTSQGTLQGTVVTKCDALDSDTDSDSDSDSEQKPPVVPPFASPPSSRNGTHPPAKPLPTPEDLSPDEVGRAVMIDLGISGRDLPVALETLIRAEARLKGYEPEKTRQRLSDAWREYEAAIPRLKYAMKPETFYGSGRWKDSKLWPWKDGEVPKPVSTTKYFDPNARLAKTGGSIVKH